MTLQAPAVEEVREVFICSNSNRQDTEGQNWPAFNAGEDFQIALLKLNNVD